MKSKASFVISCVLASLAVLIGTVFSINAAHKLGGVLAPNFGKLDGISAFDSSDVSTDTRTRYLAVQKREEAMAEINSQLERDKAERLKQKRENYRNGQIELKRLAFYDGVIDGQWGPQSREALKKYLRMMNQSGEGWLTIDILNELRNTPTPVQNVYIPPQPDLSSVSVQTATPKSTKDLIIQNFPGTWKMLSPIAEPSTGAPYNYNNVIDPKYMRPECEGDMFMTLKVPTFQRFPVVGTMEIYWQDSTPIPDASESDYTFTSRVDLSYDEENQTISLKPRRLTVVCKLDERDQLGKTRRDILEFKSKWNGGVLSDNTLVYQVNDQAKNSVPKIEYRFFKQ